MSFQQLNNDCIREILEPAPPSLLVPSRLICRDWAEIAEGRLKARGCSIHLRNPEEVLKYLRLLQQSESAPEKLPAQMELSIHVQVGPETQHVETLNAATEICRHPRAPPVCALELSINVPTCLGPPLDPCLTALLESAKSMRHLTIRLPNLDGPFAELPPVGLFPNMEALETISLEYAPAKLFRKVAMVLDNVAGAAGQAVRRLEVRTVAWGGQWRCEGGEALQSLESRLPSLASWCLGNPQFAGLAELVLYNGFPGWYGMEHLATRFRFGSLQILRLEIVSYLMLRHLPDILTKSCPNLAHLEVTEVTPSHLPPPAPLLLPVPPPPHAIPHAGITRFGHFIRNVSHETVRGASPRALSHTNAMMQVMGAFPLLASVETDFFALTAMASIIQNPAAALQAGEGAAGLFVQNAWPSVRNLAVSIPHDSIGPYGSNDPFLGNVCRLIDEMYPNLERLTLKLGTFRYWRRIQQHSEMAYPFGLAFGLRSGAIRHVEIIDFNSAWLFPGAEDANPCRSGQALQEHHNFHMETLTIRGALPSYYREAAGWPTDAVSNWNPTPAVLSLDSLLRLIPPNFPVATLRIDGTLLHPIPEDIPQPEHGHSPRIVII